MSSDDAMIPFRWNVFNEKILPAFRALVLTEDPKPILQLVKEALSQIPAKREKWNPESGQEETSSKISRCNWFSLYALAPLCEQGGTDDLETFLAQLISPRGKKDPWGEEYALRISQLFRSFRPDLSKRLATFTWPDSLEEGESPAADEQVDELFAELVLFFAAPRLPGEGEFSSDPEGGALSAISLELNHKLWHIPLAASRNGFSDVREVCPALFSGKRRFPFSRAIRTREDSETFGPLLPSEVPTLQKALKEKFTSPSILSRVVQNTAEEGLALFTWRGGL